MKNDSYWMKRTLVLARKGIGNTQPNPLVGAIVLDKNGNCVGKGFHPKAGEPHAEIFALEEAKEKAMGGTLFVNLEPCAHFGKTPPCADRIIQSKVKRVVVAVLDSNPLVNGKGVRKLIDAGIHVDVGILEKEAKRLNLPFFFSIEHNRPFVTAKVALSKDWKLGIKGKKVQISGPECERTTMRLRANAGAIVIGVNTLLADDPKLTVRGKYAGRKPIRAIIDPHLKTPGSARIFKEPGEIWIFCNQEVSDRKIVGARIIPVLEPSKILEAFHSEGINAVLIEGGSKTLDHFANAKLIDRWYIYRSPTVLGENQTIQLFPEGKFSFEELYSIRCGLDTVIVSDHVLRAP